MGQADAEPPMVGTEMPEEKEPGGLMAFLQKLAPVIIEFSACKVCMQSSTVGSRYLYKYSAHL